MLRRGRKLLWLGAMALGATLAFCPATAKAAGVPVDEAHFPDRAFLEYVEENFDLNGDFILSDAEIENVTEISVYYGISSLEGIGNFKKLDYLNCSDMLLTSLDVSENTALTCLYCDHNQLTSLDLSKNTALVSLYCSRNQLTSLDVSKNTALTSLACNRNQLTVLDLSKNTSLERLYCQENQLTKLSLTQNTALIGVTCGSNQLISLDVSKNTALTELSCSYNQLASLNVGSNTLLNSLNCSHNQLKNLDVSKNVDLKGLECSNNQLTNLELSQNTELQGLSCSGNQLTNLELSKNTRLHELLCSGNQLTRLNVNQNPSLMILDCSGNELASLDLSKNTILVELYCNNNQLTNLDVSNNNGINRLNCYNNRLTSIDFSKNNSLSYYGFDIVKGSYVRADSVHSFDITLPVGKNTFDLTTLPGNFDVQFASDWKGGTVSGNILTVSDKQVTYQYTSVGKKLYVTLNVKQAEMLPAPVLTGVTNTAAGVEVKWNAVKGAEMYRIMYKEPGGSYKTSGYTSSTNYVATGLTSGAEYIFTVRCVTSDKKTYTSSYDNKGLSIVYKPAVAKLATPVITKMENASTGVKVTWDAVEGAEMYRLMYKEPGGSFVTGGYTTGTSYTVKNLTSGVAYAFTVRCMTADKKANTSDYDRVGTTITYIAAPALQKVENASNGVKLTWNLSAGAELYKVMYKEAGGSYKTAGYTAENNYTITGLTAGVEYTFTARCMTADKKTYTSSYDSKGLNLVYKPVAAKLATPAITKFENTASGVKVTWGAVEGAEMYRLMYKEPDGTFKTGGYTTGTSYTVKNLVGGVTYAFTVRCMTADKKTNTSDYDRVGTITTYIAPPVLTKVANTSTGVKVTWKAAAGAELYKVMYMGPDGTWKTGGYTAGTSYTVKKLEEGTAYAFTVRCMTADKSAYTSGYDKVGLSITH